MICISVRSLGFCFLLQFGPSRSDTQRNPEHNVEKRISETVTILARIAVSPYSITIKNASRYETVMVNNCTYRGWIIRR
jgi:hypothetical protein